MRRWNLIWYSVLAVTFLLHLLTITLSPLMNEDESQIIDYGRTLLDPDGPWSLTIDTHGRNGILPTPVFVLVQQAWFHAFGVSLWANRVLTALCAVAAVCAFRWMLRSLGVPIAAATIAALALSCDPLLVTSFRSGRADGFAIALACLACGFWANALSKRSRWQALASGVCVALAMLSWPTASVTLLLGAAIYLDRALAGRGSHVRSIVSALLGAGMVGMLWFVTYWHFGFIDRIRDTTESQLNMYPGEHPLHGSLFAVIWRAYRQAPWVIAASAIGLVLCVRSRTGRWFMATAAAAFVVAVLRPPFYEWRLLYVMPLLYACLALVLSSRRLGGLVLIGCVLPGLAVNLGLRSGVAWLDREQRDAARYELALENVVPHGAVVVGRRDHYFVGVRNGWQMFPEFHFGTIVSRYPKFWYLERPNDERPAWTNDVTFERIGTVRLGGDGRGAAGLKRRGYNTDVYLCTPGTAANRSPASGSEPVGP